MYKYLLTFDMHVFKIHGKLFLNLKRFEAVGQEFAKNFEITGTIYSNSESSEQFLVTEFFFNFFLEVSQI